MADLPIGVWRFVEVLLLDVPAQHVHLHPDVVEVDFRGCRHEFRADDRGWVADTGERLDTIDAVSSFVEREWPLDPDTVAELLHGDGTVQVHGDVADLADVAAGLVDGEHSAEQVSAALAAFALDDDDEKALALLAGATDWSSESCREAYARIGQTEIPGLIEAAAPPRPRQGEVTDFGRLVLQLRATLRGMRKGGPRHG